jgi:hypothetical protein
VSKYKLVPVEPTQEMLDAAIQDGVCVDGKPVWKKSVTFQAKWKYQQMLAAAPAVQGEPVAWATRLYNTAYHAGHHDTVEGCYTHVYPQDMDSYHEDIVQEWLADNPQPVEQAKPTRQYYYKVNNCIATSPDSDQCICWHNEGEGPLPDDSATHWRTDNPQPAVQGEPAEQYNHKRIGWELERTAMGDGYYGNALRVAKDIPGLTDQDRAVLDRYATGSQHDTDHIALQDIAMRVYATSQPRSDALIVEQTERIAAILAKAFFGSELPPGANFRDSENLKAQACWRVAADIQEELTDTDVENALAELEDEQQPTVQGEPIPAGFALIKLDSRTGKPLVTSEMKVKHIGEYWWDEEAPYYDEHGVLHGYVARHAVPWSLCKEIYKSMASTAMLSVQPAEEQPDVDDSLSLVSDELFATEFNAWWEQQGQFCRAGGGDYERTFAFEAWRYLHPQLMKLQKVTAEQQPTPDVTQLVDALCRCLHQANYSIGCEDALKAQLEKVREIANDALSAYHKQGVEL